MVCPTPMLQSRLLHDADASYLRGRTCGVPLQHKLRCMRRRALKLYVRRLHADFSRTWRLCRLLAPIADDHEFAIRLVRSGILFHGTFLVVNVVLTIGAEQLVRSKLSELARLGSSARESAHTLLETAATWSPAGAALENME